jgi:hypothetical protein
MAPLTTCIRAWSISASASTIAGFLPPSSSWIFAPRSPASLRRLAPTSFEPVKLMATTRSSFTRGSPTEPARPVTRFRTPGGRPASARASTSRTAQSGVWLAGLKTTVLPNASAGAIFQAGIAIGKFQGVMTAQTPSGSWTV